MNTALSALQFFAMFFVGALAFSYSVTKIRLRRLGRALHELPVESVVRMRANGGVYRSRFLGFTGRTMRFSAPVQRSAYVPLRVGDALTIEAPLPGCCLIFRTEVLARDAATKVFTVVKPVKPAVIDRREEPRNTAFAGTRVEVNNDWAELLDLSENGARALTLSKLSAGDVVRVKCDALKINQLAWVLEVVPETVDGRQGSIVRFKFLDPLPPLEIPTAKS